jgi:hypothetical protein
MVNRMPRFSFRRFTILCIFAFLTSSCVSLSKYRQSEAELARSKAACSDLIVKNSILEHDTSEYGVKYRTLQSDINYLQNTTRSESNKLSGEMEKQRQELDQKISESKILREKLSAIEDQSIMKRALADSMEKQLRDSFKAEIAAGILSELRENYAVRLNLNTTEFFKKQPPFITEQGQKISDRIFNIMNLDSTLTLQIERIGPEYKTGGKSQEDKPENNVWTRQILIYYYFNDRKKLPASRIQIISKFSEGANSKEVYSVVIHKKGLD